MVPALVHAYNCIRSTAMGFQPILSLVFLTLPISLYFGAQSADMNATTSMKFVQQFHEGLRWVYKIAQQVIERENKRHKQNFYHKVKCTQLHEGNLFLLKRTAVKGKHKIQDHCEKTIYWVEGQPYVGLPVFRIALVEGEVRCELCIRTCYFPSVVM